MRLHLPAEPRAASYPQPFSQGVFSVPTLDEEKHAPLARKLLGNLCGEDPANWARATAAATAALSSRRALGDGVVATLKATL